MGLQQIPVESTFRVLMWLLRRSNQVFTVKEFTRSFMHSSLSLFGPTGSFPYTRVSVYTLAEYCRIVNLQDIAQKTAARMKINK